MTSRVGGSRTKSLDGWTGLAEDGALLLLSLAILLLPAWIRGWPTGALLREHQALPPARIDVNRAPWHEWMLLEGVGESRARGIVAHREAQGPFLSLDELEAVPGMPRGWAERARPYLFFGPRERGGKP